jgi:hypothetical protein
MERVGVVVGRRVVASRIFLLLVERSGFGFHHREIGEVAVLDRLVLQALVLESELGV